MRDLAAEIVNSSRTSLNLLELDDDNEGEGEATAVMERYCLRRKNGWQRVLQGLQRNSFAVVDISGEVEWTSLLESLTEQATKFFSTGEDEKVSILSWSE